MNKLLITGINGVIGNVLSKHLSDSFDIYGVDQEGAHPSEKIFKADISKYHEIANVIREVSDLRTVIHLAADSQVNASWESALKNNIIATRNLYEASAKNQIKRVILASSNHVTGGYEGIPPNLHMRSNPKMITVFDPIRPDSDYGSSKAFGEAVARQYYELYGIESVCLRIGTVLADDDPTKNDRFLKTWLSHRDLVQLFKKSISAEKVKFGIYYGVSNNKGRFWDISNVAEDLYFYPQDDAWVLR